MSTRIHDRAEDDIEKYGRHVVCVAPTEDEALGDPNDYFSYTIGNAVRVTRSCGRRRFPAGVYPQLPPK